MYGVRTRNLAHSLHTTRNAALPSAVIPGRRDALQPPDLRTHFHDLKGQEHSQEKDEEYLGVDMMGEILHRLNEHVFQRASHR